MKTLLAILDFFLLPADVRELSRLNAITKQLSEKDPEYPLKHWDNVYHELRKANWKYHQDKADLFINICKCALNNPLKVHWTLNPCT